MSTLSLTLNADRLQQALMQAPERLEREIDKAIGRTVLEISRTARSLAPKATSLLTNSITVRRPDKTSGEVVAGQDYAAMVERGTRGGRMPPVKHILDWVLLRKLQPTKPGLDDPRDLAFAIARSIAKRGTPAQAFMAPALSQHRARAEFRINQAIEAALQ